MAFLEDPRLRQRWTQTLHATESATENAAAGIWTFQHNYINPCLGSIVDSLEACAAPCLGDREDREARRRQRERGRAYGFDFYDDWDDDDEALVGGNWETGASAGGSASRQGRGWGALLGSWGAARGEDWDRLIGGSGSVVAEGVDTQQPRRKRGMSYGTATQPGTAGGAGAGRRGSSSGRRSRVNKAAEQEDDPTIIPSTAPLGFLGRLPFKIGGTLRYKPSAANLRDHPGGGPSTHFEEGERQPLLNLDGEEDDHHTSYYHSHDATRNPDSTTTSRKRSGTTGSGDTSDSFRSRNDLFPSDEEADEDAVPLDDEFAMALGSVVLQAPGDGDESSSKSRRKSSLSRGKRKKRGSQSDTSSSEGGGVARSVSRTTIASGVSTYSFHPAGPEAPASRSASMASLMSLPTMADAERDQQLRDEDAEAAREEDDAVERRRMAASRLAAERGLSSDPEQADVVREVKSDDAEQAPESHDIPANDGPNESVLDADADTRDRVSEPGAILAQPPRQGGGGREAFVPARLPHFQ